MERDFPVAADQGHDGAVQRDVATEAQARRHELRRGIAYGLISGLAAIACCVSPVVLALIGVATAAEAVTLGDTLYYGYGWWFRGAGFLIAGCAIYLHLRRRRSCSLRGAYHHRRLLAILFGAGLATYAGLFWFTKYLGIWFG
ncbi:MAG: hypothetical protein L0177_03360 [Chloroflexi bacterium]|nr:hypothetical protein [Chloroflexota bacterium]